MPTATSTITTTSTTITSTSSSTATSFNSSSNDFNNRHYMDYDIIASNVTEHWNSSISLLWNYSGNYSTDLASKIDHKWPALCLFIIPICAVVGNIMVCMAVKSETKLQNMFNYFLVSLAVSDMMSAVIVMPLSIIKAAVGKLVIFFKAKVKLVISSFFLEGVLLVRLINKKYNFI